MYIWEMKSLPNVADKAVLEWDSNILAPRRDRKIISLPRSAEASYFSLNEGNQFIFCYPSSGSTWFGGTDEEPFLVEMTDKVISHFKKSQGNSSELYRFLVPDEVLTLSEETGEPYKRQGDIFATRFCREKYFETRLTRLLGPRAQVKNGSSRVFETRHEATGIMFNIFNIENQKNTTLFKGKIEAPDHKPLVIDDGIYLLGQTKYIAHPTYAD